MSKTKVQSRKIQCSITTVAVVDILLRFELLDIALVHRRQDISVKIVVEVVRSRAEFLDTDVV